jgi:hypothetical protein
MFSLTPLWDIGPIHRGIVAVISVSVAPHD